MRITTALEKYLVQLRADGRSPHTVGQYRRHVQLLACWARQDGHCRDRIESLDHEAIARFLASRAATMRPDGRAKRASAVNCLRSSIKGFFAYCHRAGYIRTDPGRLIRHAICSPPPPRALSDSEQRRLLAVLRKASTPEEKRDGVLFRLMLATGIRVGSVVAVEIEDVRLEEGELYLRITKRDAPDRIPLGADSVRDLRRFIGKRTTGPLFHGPRGQPLTTRHIQRRFRAWLQRARIDRPLSPHSLRHTVGLRVYRETGDLLLTKEVLRHRSITSTLAYAHADPVQLRRILS